MSDRKKYPRAVALAMAEELKAILAPACERIEIAGSLRRGRADVGDIELVFVGKTEVRQDPEEMFSTISVNLAAEAISALEKSGVLMRRLNVNGSQTYGPQNKLMVHVASGIPVDLFATKPENWFVALVIRTGSKETNLRLTTGAQKRGASLMAYGCGIKWSNGEITPANSERDVFQLCDIPYLEPEKR